MKFSHIIFDFDGTLVDTCEGILATSRCTVDALGLPQTSDAQMRSGIGLPLRQSLKLGCNIPEELADRACELYREFFNEVAYDYIKGFPGVAETLRVLKDRGVEMSIATSRRADSLTRILSNLSLTDMFRFRLSADMDIRPKPAPDMVLKLLDMMEASADDTLVVGDTTFDLDMGSGALCRTCGVTYGNHTRAQLQTSHPDWIIDSFPELLDVVA